MFNLVLSSFFSMYTVWKLAVFSSEVGTDISSRLYKYYMTQNWLYYTKESSAQLTKQVSTESSRVAQGIIEPLLQMNAKLIVALIILIAIIIFNPSIALVGILIFIISYYILFKIVRKKLHDNGEIISKVMTKRFKLLNEGLGGIKDLIIYNRINHYIEQFIFVNKEFAKARGANIAYAQVPRYFIELVAFASVISLILFLLKSNSEGIQVILPVLSVYALAALKLLPSLQQVYSGFAQVKGNLSAFESIRNDLDKSKDLYVDCNVEIDRNLEKIKFSEELCLKDVIFSYDGKKTIFKKLNIEIKCENIVGFTGPSGSGKSTLIDILLGLIYPDSGNIYLDSKKLNKSEIKSFQKMVGFVPQSIFLAEGTIAENIAFGISPSEIEYSKINKAIKLAQLDEFVNCLEKKCNTQVGERGVQLSGGQRQRIGIARALYNDPEIIVFDESTSSLDGNTEKLIMDSIHRLSNNKTIIMIAHRLETIKNCDVIFYIEDGQLIDKGTYSYLKNNNESFKRMISK